MSRLVALVVAATLAAGIVALSRPGDADLVFEAYVLFLGAVAIVVLVRRAHSIAPLCERSSIEIALAAPRPAPERPAELVRMERRVVLAVANSGDHAGLAPVMRAIATPLLATRGIQLESDPEGARALVGEDAWSLIRPDFERPEDPFSPGIPEERLAAAVTRLEELAR